MGKGEFAYEESAEVVTVTGWACKTCRRWWGKDEHMARWCCALDCPCDCGGRREKHWTVCKACRDRNEDEKWFAVYAKAIEWDGQAPLTCFRDDLFFWSAEELYDYLGVNVEVSVEDLRLVLAVEEKPRHFCLSEYMQDELPRDFDESAFADIDRTVNEFIQGGRPWCFISSNQAVTVESVLAHLGPIPGESLS